MAERTCSIDGCARPHLARGWCGTHYRRWRLHGTTADPEPFRPKPCSVNGCERDAEKRGWCDPHYRRWQRNGDPGPAEFRRWNTEAKDGKKCCNGCSEWLPLDDFPWIQADNRRAGSCGKCRRKGQEAWRAKNPDYWRKWQRANPDKVNAIVQQRRATREGRRAERVDRAVVFERDNYTCKLCGDPLDMEAPRWAPWSATVDHIVPLSIGGDHIYSNVQAAHFRCNVVKGNRTLAS